MAAQNADGYNILIVHSDADDETDERAFYERIKPGFELVKNADEPLCKNLVAVIPIQMTEAWLLADKDTFREELGTNKTFQELGLTFSLKHTEKISNPKSKIQDIMRIAFKNSPRRRVSIGSLYSPLGQKVSLKVLEKLPSYLKFKNNLLEALIKLNFIRIG